MFCIFCRFNKYGILLVDLSTQVIWKLVRYMGFFLFVQKFIKKPFKIRKGILSQSKGQLISE
jgi:hypothetical protein